MSTMAPERTYALIKIGAGDYLLPSNDRRIIWRIGAYGIDDVLWALWWMPYDEWERDPAAALEDGNKWTCYGRGYRLRRDAVNLAMTPSTT